MIGIVVSLLLLVQFSCFSLLRSALNDSTPASLVMFYTELIKLCISFVCANEKKGELFRNPFATLLPTICFVCMNMVGYTVAAQMSATTYVMMMQLRIPMTCLVSYLVLDARYSCNQMFCIFLICLSCMNICYDKREISPNVSLDVVHIGGCLLQVSLSALCAVYMQRVFERNVALLWVRNVELSLISIPFYACIIAYYEIPLHCSSVGYLFSVIGALGGILVALTLIYGDAVEKTLATSMALVVVAIAEHVIYGHWPRLTNVSFYTICFASVLAYNVEKWKTNSENNTVHTPLLNEEKT